MADAIGIKARKAGHILKHEYILLLILGAISGVVVSVTQPADSIGLGSIIVSLGVILLVTARAPSAVRAPVAVAFLLRLLLALSYAYIVPLPELQGDALAFERVGWEMAEGWHEGQPVEFVTGAYFYSMLIGFLYYVLGRSPLLIQVVNVFFGTLIVLNVFRTGKQLWGQRVACTAAWITALFPTLNFYAALTLREVLIVYFFTLYVLYLVRWIMDDQLSNYFKALIALLIATVTHSGFFFLYAISMALAARRWLESLLKNRVMQWLKTTMVIAGVLLFVAILTVTGIGLDKIGGTSRLSLEALGEKQAIAARGRAQYLSNLQMTSWVGTIWQTPIRTVYFLFTPFPWMVDSPVDAIGLLDALLYLWLFWNAIRSMRALRNHGRSELFWILVLILGVGTGVFATGTSNYGTAIRHRAKFSWLLGTLAAYNITAWCQRKGSKTLCRI